MIEIPRHVMQPGDPANFIAEEYCRPLKSAGLGYSIIKALGAKKGYSPASIKVIQNWCQKHCELYPDIVPDQRKLRNASFNDRLYRPSQNALENAICYHSNSGKVSYLDIYKMIWIEQRWPELCRALANDF
jgi:hypothetical protein